MVLHLDHCLQTQRFNPSSWAMIAAAFSPIMSAVLLVFAPTISGQIDISSKDQGMSATERDDHRNGESCASYRWNKETHQLLSAS